MQTSNNDRINSIQALRALAFLGIFFNHSGFIINWSELGVSIFFVLSGFLLYIRYVGTELPHSTRDCFRFAVDKIKKIYPLHLITLIIMFVFYMCGPMGMKRRLVNCIVAALNVFLVQSFIPNMGIATALNGVAWYLSTAAFLYFCFPKILYLVDNKGKNKHESEAPKAIHTCTLAIVCLLALLIQFGICIALIKCNLFNSAVYFSLSYSFPPIRLVDLLFGIFVGRLYELYKNKDTNVALASIFEIIVILLAIGTKIWGDMEPSSIKPIYLASKNWTTIYVSVAALAVYVFAINKGIISKAVTNRVLVWIGDLSGYAFLIHFVIIILVEKITNTSRSIEEVGVAYKLLVILIELLLSIGLSYLYRLYDSKINSLFERIYKKQK